MISQKVFEQKKKAKEEEAVLKYNTDLQSGLEAIQSDPVYKSLLNALSHLAGLMLNENKLYGVITVNTVLTPNQSFYVRQYIELKGYKVRIENLTDSSTDITVGVYSVLTSNVSVSNLFIRI